MELNWKQIIVVLLIAVFLFEIIAFGILGNPQQPTQTNPSDDNKPTSVSGIANAMVTVDQYEPYLILQEVNVSDDIIAQIERLEEVEDVRFISGNYVVTLVKRDDIELVFDELLGLGLTPIATVFISFPASLEIEKDGKAEVLLSEGVTITQNVDYFIPIGESVNTSIGIVGENGRATQLASFEFRKIREKINTTARITKLQSSGFVYEIDWADRNLIDVTKLKKELNGSAINYLRKSYVEFRGNLTEQQKLDFTKLAYVTQLISNRVFVNMSFIDKETAENDMHGEKIFPSSVLTVSGKQPDNFAWKGVPSYTYQAELINGSGYKWMKKTFEVKFASEKNMSKEIAVAIEAEVVGRTVTNIIGAEEI